MRLDGAAPLLLNGYGSYEIPNDPYFSKDRLSLLDRGWVFAIAHIRWAGSSARARALTARPCRPCRPRLQPLPGPRARPSRPPAWPAAEARPPACL